MDNLIYEDKPQGSSASYGGNLAKSWAWGMQWMPIWLVIMALFVLVLTQVRQEEITQIFMLVSVFIGTFFAWGNIATKHQVLSDKIRIVLGWIFHFDIPFSNIENIKEATLKDLLGFHRSFIPFLSGNDVLQITRKHGLKVNIIPGNRTLFLENLNKSLDEWRGCSKQ